MEPFRAPVRTPVSRNVLVLCLFFASLAALGHAFLVVPVFGQGLISVPAAISAALVDPNKAPSELNHHIAGWALMGVGWIVLVSFVYPTLKALRYFWPALFLLMGVFLALWSDAEMWPRGNLNWGWLLHHDHEAGQHKIYALLLIAIGIVEYLRARGSLNRFWRAWAFSALAIVGALSLLMHDHSAGSGATLPETRAYLINPALSPDGNVPSLQALGRIPGSDHSTIGLPHSAMTMDHSRMNHPSMSIGGNSEGTSTPSPDHHHYMSPSMLLVEREHFWFMIVGLGVALFKLISDGDFWPRRFVAYVWPGGMMMLGLLLVFYRE